MPLELNKSAENSGLLFFELARACLDLASLKTAAAEFQKRFLESDKKAGIEGEATADTAIKGDNEGAWESPEDDEGQDVLHAPPGKVAMEFDPYNFVVPSSLLQETEQ